VPLTAAQRAIRRSGITASDVRALVGEDPYGRTAHDVYVSKVHEEEPLAESEAMALGNELEPIILRRLARKIGLYLLRRDPDTLTVRHRVHVTHVATPDAFLAMTAVHGVEALGEVKAVGLHNAHDWGPSGEELPDWVTIQATWQAYVADVPLVHVGALIGTDVRVYRVVPDPELVAVLVEAADRHWTDHVVPRLPPPVDGSEGARRMLRARWPRERLDVLRAGAPAEALARRYFEASRSKASAEAAAELARQQLMELVGEHAGIVGDGWRLNLKWQEPCVVAASRRNGFRRFDLRAVKSLAK